MDTDFKAIKKRFFAINRERMRRVQTALRWRQRDFLELLPLFFHLNHAMLPGYVSKNTPAGVPLYIPSKKGLEAVKRLAKSFSYKKPSQRSFDIHAIFMMGSMGTIAQSEQSDFDIWVCYDPTLDQIQLAELKAKCDSIEQWAAGIGLEVHFFTMNADAFRRGEVHELSSESSGSTQHHLLLEEFYRTSILVAGRFPIWWLVPPDQEENYPDFVHQLIHKRFVKDSEVIDFGGLDRIPADEFFGAALWQVYKGIDSPYKSVLKILLMEAYASQYPNSELLSLQFKRMVYAGIMDLNALDPYNMLLARLEGYLQTIHEDIRLRLVRRCFYFKVNLPLSNVPKDAEDWQQAWMWELVTRWNWDTAELALLDNRSQWKVQRVLEERKLLVDELTHSYLFLSNFARLHTGLSRISQKDLNILGRKLYAAFERKAGKIEMINRGISASIVERRITLQQSIGRDSQEESWILLVGEPGEENKSKTFLKRGRCVAELLTWCHINHIINPGTVISLDTKQGILSVKEVKSILEALEHEFTKGAVYHPALEDYAQAPAIVGGVLLANVGLDPLPAHSRRGTDIVSDRSDILNYSGFSFNLALSFDMVVITSWNEILTYRYQDMMGLMECISQYLWWHKHKTPQHDFRFPAYSFSSTHGVAIAGRIQELFADLVQAFYAKDGLRQVRYVLEVQQIFYVFTTDKENFTYQRTESFQELCNYLSQAQSKFVPIVADRCALIGTVLPKVLSKNKPEQIQLFYEVKGPLVNIYLLDEHGSLFYQQLPFHDDHSLLNQFILFFNSILGRQRFLCEEGQANRFSDERIEFLAVNKKPNGKTFFERKTINRDNLTKRYFHVQVIVNVVNQTTLFTIYCDDKEFSSYEYGSGLFREVARYVLARRESGARYPIYITDLDLAPSLLGDRPNSQVLVIEYLNYKKRIEQKLNAELANL